MANLVEKISNEFNEWLKNVTTQNTDAELVLKTFGYEYTIKSEIVKYLKEMEYSKEFEQFLLGSGNTLEFLYYEYMLNDDTADIYHEIIAFMSNVKYKHRMGKYNNR